MSNKFATKKKFPCKISIKIPAKEKAPAPYIKVFKNSPDSLSD